MPWILLITKLAIFGNGMLFAMKVDEFIEVAMYVSVPLWFLCGAWNLYILRDEHRRAALRQLAEEQACAQQKENPQPSSLDCDESDSQTLQ